MNNIKSLDHIGIRVTEFKRAIVFYEQFGFEVVRKDMKERVIVLFHRNGVTLNLLDSASDFFEKRNVLMDESILYAGYTHIAFRVKDINRAIQYVNLLGIDITEGPVRFGDGKTSIFIRDPDLNVIEFTQPSLVYITRSDLDDEFEQELVE